jgi:hypothetical protein
MRKTNLNIYIKKFLKLYGSKVNQKKSELSPLTALEMSLQDFKFEILIKTAYFSFLFILPIMLVFFYKKLTVPVISFASLDIVILLIIVFVFPKLIPRFDYYSEIKNRIFRIKNKYINSEQLLNFNEVSESLMNINNDNKRIELIKSYYEEVQNSKEIGRSTKTTTFKIIGLYYFLDRKLKIQRNNKELAYLLGSLIKGGQGDICANISVELNKLNNINDEKYNRKDFEKLRSILGDMKIYLHNILKEIEKDITQIDLLK